MALTRHIISPLFSTLSYSPPLPPAPIRRVAFSLAGSFIRAPRRRISRRSLVLRAFTGDTRRATKKSDSRVSPGYERGGWRGITTNASKPSVSGEIFPLALARAIAGERARRSLGSSLHSSPSRRMALDPGGRLCLGGRQRG